MRKFGWELGVKPPYRSPPPGPQPGFRPSLGGGATLEMRPPISWRIIASCDLEFRLRDYNFRCVFKWEHILIGRPPKLSNMAMGKERRILRGILSVEEVGQIRAGMSSVSRNSH